MYVCAELRPLGPEEICLKIRSLRDAVICIAWLKCMSIFLYLVLYFVSKAVSKGTVASIIVGLILVVIPLQLFTAVLLFMGALERKPMALQMSLFFILLIAAQNTLIGLTGCIFFIRVGVTTMHFVLALLYAILAFSIFTVLCHDVIVIHTLKVLLRPQPCSEDCAA
ncbi:uncharacterized protein LOC142976948 [Anticarsia gemmatalis]|uniref:uncharacterized protein LOC142976948 n=1 Tax=Anticarsia gemmatalis TaxID=129554 RepID=UPI003F760762